MFLKNITNAYAWRIMIFCVSLLSIVTFYVETFKLSIKNYNVII